ncbi:TPA: HK97-gp10 family putative phage morphogenesis protein [Streptococcus suis]
MARASIEIKGNKKMAQDLKVLANLTAVKGVVKDYTARLDTVAKRKAFFSKGYSTGATKRSITPEIRAMGLEGAVEAKTDYSGYLEKGTRFMEAQPFMKPALEKVEPEFIEALGEVLK